jgi:Tol biopolymer transport system component
MIYGVCIALGLVGSAHAAEVSVAAKGHAYNPAWSSDGQWLAFEVNRFEEGVDLFVVKVQNGNPVGTPTKISIPGAGSSFSSGGSMVAAPNWHPQGMLIFEGSNAGGTNRLYYFKPGGQSAAELLSVSQIAGDLSWPAISGDGKLVSFVSDAAGAGDIYTWDRSNNQVASSVASPFSEMAPRYHKSTGKVVYSRKNQGGEDLFTFEAAKSMPFVGGNGDQTRPAWASDAVTFFSNERGDDRWDVVVSDAVGQKRTVARDVRLPLRATPAVSPDGRWIAYGFEAPEQANAIGFAKVDGSATATVDTGLVAAGEPALIEAGGRIFVAFTALPQAGADWRKLQIIDVTDKLR